MEFEVFDSDLIIQFKRIHLIKKQQNDCYLLSTNKITTTLISNSIIKTPAMLRLICVLLVLLFPCL